MGKKKPKQRSIILVLLMRIKTMRETDTQTNRIANEVSGQSEERGYTRTHTHVTSAFAVLAAPSLSPEESVTTFHQLNNFLFTI